MSGPSDAGTIDFPPDDRHDSGREVDAETTVSAAAVAFNGAVLPKNLPDWLKNALLDRAEQIRDAAGDFLIDNRMNPNGARSRQAKADADDGDNLSQYAQLVYQEQAERAAWARTSSTLGGVTMTGAEWATFASRLREDEELHRQIIDAFRKRGMSEEEAQARYDRVADVAEIAAIPPGQRTEQQTMAFEKANANPTFKQDMAAAHSIEMQRPSNDQDVNANRSSKPAANMATSPSDADPVKPVVAINGPGF